MELRDADWLFANPRRYRRVASQHPGMFAVMEIEFIASMLQLVVTLLRWLQYNSFISRLL